MHLRRTPEPSVPRTVPPARLQAKECSSGPSTAYSNDFNAAIENTKPLLHKAAPAAAVESGKMYQQSSRGTVTATRLSFPPPPPPSPQLHTRVPCVRCRSSSDTNIKRKINTGGDGVRRPDPTRPDPTRRTQLGHAPRTNLSPDWNISPRYRHRARRSNNPREQQRQ